MFLTIHSDDVTYVKNALSLRISALLTVWNAFSDKQCAEAQKIATELGALDAILANIKNTQHLASAFELPKAATLGATTTLAPITDIPLTEIAQDLMRAPIPGTLTEQILVSGPPKYTFSPAFLAEAGGNIP